MKFTLRTLLTPSFAFVSTSALAVSFDAGTVQSVKIYEREENRKIISTAVVTIKGVDDKVISHHAKCERTTDHRYVSRTCVLNASETSQIYFTHLTKTGEGIYSHGILNRAGGRGSLTERAYCTVQTGRSDGLVEKCEVVTLTDFRGPDISVERVEENVYIATIKNGMRHPDVRVSCEKNTFAHNAFLTCSFPTNDIENRDYYSNRVVIAEPKGTTTGAYYEVNTAGYAQIPGQCWYAIEKEIRCTFN